MKIIQHSMEAADEYYLISTESTRRKILLMLDASTGMKIFQSDALLDDIDEFH
jgi:hypothetical protein